MRVPHWEDSDEAILSDGMESLTDRHKTADTQYRQAGDDVSPMQSDHFDE